MIKSQSAMRSSRPLEPHPPLGLTVVNYVLITPAKNEESNIRKTIESIISQTIRPFRWIIVDDNSTDRTAEIVKEYLTKHSFITLLELRTSSERTFGKKVAAFNAGLKLLECEIYSFIGNLDADISLVSDYYDQIISEFKREPLLGIAGGAVHTTIDGHFVTNDQTLDSVGGAVQLFRRECFDQIGGYIALESGGIDAAAEITARMYGWRVRKFPRLKVYEHRRTGTAQYGPLRAMYNLGVRFHSLGYGTIFFISRCIYRLKDRPFLLGSTLSLIGFAYSKLKGYPICLPPEAVSYLRAEQIDKLKQAAFRRALKVIQFLPSKWLRSQIEALSRSEFHPE